MRDFDLSKAILNDEPMFAPFHARGRGVQLRDAELEARTELLLMERDGAAIAFLARQMAYHHVAQGEFAGEPYLVSF